jgi:hypothetical protein
MDVDERCPLNPSLRRVECSHCQGPPRGTHNNPSFSIREDSYEGFPTVEVLKNGGPVHAWDRNFSFGRRKAEILLACVDVLREFWEASDPARLAFVTRIVESQEHSLRIRVYVQPHQYFDHSTGLRVNQPWLHLEALAPNSGDIGLGAIKCRAICAVERDLREWLRKCGGRW